MSISQNIYPYWSHNHKSSFITKKSEKFILILFLHFLHTNWNTHTSTHTKTHTHTHKSKFWIRRKRKCVLKTNFVFQSLFVKIRVSLPPSHNHNYIRARIEQPTIKFWTVSSFYLRHTILKICFLKIRNKKNHI